MLVPLLGHDHLVSDPSSFIVYILYYHLAVHSVELLILSSNQVQKLF
jgi:hypothetical protein